MSLRRDIQAAFDEITPPLGGMPERVAQTVLSDTKRRKRKMTVRARVPLPLVAVFVAVALVATAVIGNQLIQAWNAAHNPSPAGQIHLTALQQLEARPLNLPGAHSLADCPNSPRNNLGFDYGDGPVYANGSGAVPTAWGNYWDIPYILDRNVNGLVLIRGRDLITGERVIFFGKHAVGLGASTHGAPAGWHTEAVLDSSRPDLRFDNRGEFVVRQSLSSSYIGCVGLQFDGTTFSETMTTSNG